jgi:predicted ATPase/DNA-binding SARP family transcriptional activator/DNA-binding CsgD family transcriptional regulator
MRADSSEANGAGVPRRAGQDRTPAALRVRLLGDFQVSVGDLPVTGASWGRRKAQSLVKLLALAPRHRLHREQLIESLWPDQDPDAAGRNLRVNLHAARRALASADDADQTFLTIVGEEVVLQAPVPLWIDAIEFERTAGEALRTGDVELYRAALDLYGGDLLPADRYEDWTIGRRERLRDIYLKLLSGYADELEQVGDVPALLDTLERILAADPTDEPSAARLMRVYARTGQRHRALRLFRNLRDALQRELDALPDDETKRVYGEILARFERHHQAADVDDQIPRSNLPAALTSFIGREEDIRQTIASIEESRLVTLTGVGGCGKTRLATAIGYELVGRFSDGVWFVDLSPLGSAETIPAAIAGAMCLKLDASVDERTALVEMLTARDALLIIDNCEHLIAPCAALVNQLLQSCPTLHVLATSREPLRVPGELNFRVPALDLPLELAVTMDTIAPLSAVRLFMERTRQVQPAFELTPDNAPVVAEICRRLDGLPLAIELAAARVALFPVEQLAALLSDPLRLLTSGVRTAAPRQQTLRATLDWSFGLLDDAEQRLLIRLSVFAGGWTLEAAEEVSAGDGVERDDVLSLLAQLVDKSLVEVRAGTREARYRLLETIRQFASEQLASGREALLHKHHARYFLDLAEKAHPELIGERQTEWLERLEQEHDNFRQALSWATGHEHVEVEVRLCAALWRYWYFHGHLFEAERWLTAAIARAQASSVGDHLRGQLLQGAGVVAWNRGELELAADLNRQALALFREAGDLSLVSATLHTLGIIADWQHDYLDATRRYEESLRMREEIQDSLGIATSLQALGNVAREQRDLDRASALHERSLALLREMGNTRGIAFALSSLGVVAIDRGDYVRAEAFSAESLELFRELGDKAQCAITLNNIGYAAVHQGNSRRAAGLQAECLRLAQGIGDMRAMAHGFEGLATALAAPGGGADDARQAARLYGASEALRETLGLPLPEADQALNERSLTAACAALGEAAFDEARAVGRALPLDEAIGEALAASASFASGEHSQVSIPAWTPLSPRESSVAALVSQGLTNREVAGRLGLAPRTVDTHVSNILRKLGLSSRQEIAARAMRDGTA